MILTTAFQISLVCVAIYATTRTGNIFFQIRNRIEIALDKCLGESAAEYLLKSVFGCLTCMSSVWTIIYFAFFSNFFADFDILSFIYMAKIILVVCGINYIISNLLTFLQNYYEVN